MGKRAEGKKKADKGKRASPTMKGKGVDQHLGAGKNKAAGKRASSYSVREESIRNGVTAEGG